MNPNRSTTGSNPTNKKQDDSNGMRSASGFIVDENQAGKRLDSALAEVLAYLSRSAWQKRIKSSDILVNGQVATPDHRLKIGDPVTINDMPPRASSVLIPKVFEDEDVVVFDKPQGLLTHSKGVFNPEYSIADYTKEHYYPEDTTGRPGIVHRLDRATSGLIICAKNEAAKVYLQEQFANRKVEKIYYALVEGVIAKNKLVLDWPVGRNPRRPQTFRVHANGKPSVTELTVLKRLDTISLVELRPKTGRTHQLRVHLKHLGHPIIGDALYGSTRSVSRMMLHAAQLGISLPSGQSKTFTSPLPHEFTDYMESF